jgi:hypothetical protein
MLPELHTRPILEPCRKHSIWRVAVEETREIIRTI